MTQASKTLAQALVSILANFTLWYKLDTHTVSIFMHIYVYFNINCKLPSLLRFIPLYLPYTVKLVYNTTIGTNKMWSLYIKWSLYADL